MSSAARAGAEGIPAPHIQGQSHYTYPHDSHDHHSRGRGGASNGRARGRGYGQRTYSDRSDTPNANYNLNGKASTTVNSNAGDVREISESVASASTITSHSRPPTARRVRDQHNLQHQHQHHFPQARHDQTQQQLEQRVPTLLRPHSRQRQQNPDENTTSTHFNSAVQGFSQSTVIKSWENTDAWTREDLELKAAANATRDIEENQPLRDQNINSNNNNNNNCSSNEYPRTSRRRVSVPHSSMTHTSPTDNSVHNSTAVPLVGLGVQLGKREAPNILMEKQRHQHRRECLNDDSSDNDNDDGIDPQIHLDDGNPIQSPASIMRAWAAAENAKKITTKTGPVHTAPSRRSSTMSSGSEGVHNSFRQGRPTRQDYRQRPIPGSNRYRGPPGDVNNHWEKVKRSEAELERQQEEIRRRMFQIWLPQEGNTHPNEGPLQERNDGDSQESEAKQVSAESSNIVSSPPQRKPNDDVDAIKRRLASDWGIVDDESPSLKQQQQQETKDATSSATSTTDTLDNNDSHHLDTKSPTQSGIQNVSIPPGNATTAAVNGFSVNAASIGDATSTHQKRETKSRVSSVMTSASVGGGMKLDDGASDAATQRVRLTSKNLQSNASAGVDLGGIPTGTTDPRINSWVNSGTFKQATPYTSIQFVFLGLSRACSLTLSDLIVVNNQDDNNSNDNEEPQDHCQDLPRQRRASAKTSKHTSTPRANETPISPSKTGSSMAAGGASQYAGSNDGKQSTTKPLRTSTKGDPFHVSSTGGDTKTGKKAKNASASATGVRKDDQKAMYDALVAEAHRKGEKPDMGAILRQLQEREQKKIGEKQIERKKNPRQADSANLEKARTGPGVQKGSAVVKEIDHCRLDRDLEPLPDVEEIKARYKIKMAEPIDLESQIIDGEVFDWSRRQWSMAESNMTLAIFRQWLKLLSTLEEMEVCPWDERFVDGRYQIISMNWYEPHQDINNIFGCVEDNAFYAAPWSDEEFPETILPPEDEMSFEHKHETSAGYMYNWVHEDVRLLREEEARLEAEREETKRQAEQYEHELLEKEVPRSKTSNAYKINGDEGGPCILPKLYIRPMEAKDVPHIVAIHNHHIKHGYVHPDSTHMTTTNVKAQWKECQDEKFPFLIAAKTGPGTGHTQNNVFENVLGFAYVTEYRPGHNIYKFTGTAHLYVAPNAVNEGVGTCLLERLLMIFDDKYVPKNTCHFECTSDERHIYLSGKVRPLRKLVFEVNYPTRKESEYKAWVRSWLMDKYGFAKEGHLTGSGVRNRVELDCDILARKVTPFMASKKQMRLHDLS